MNALRGRIVATVIAWLMVTASGALPRFTDGDDWQHHFAYAVFSLSLLAAAVLTLRLVLAVTAGSPQPRLRTVGVCVTVLGIALSIPGAWVLPLWMFLFGVGYAAIAFGSPPPVGRAIAILSAGQLAGIVALIATIEIGVGTPDEYGDYPAAGAIALMTTGAWTILGLVTLMTRLHLPHTERGAVDPLPAAT